MKLWEKYGIGEYWFIESDGLIRKYPYSTQIEYILNRQKAIGNFFKTKYEAEKALDKLKAWKSLKDNGITFSLDENNCEPYIKIHSKEETGSLEKIIKIYDDLELIFGGE